MFYPFSFLPLNFQSFLSQKRKAIIKVEYKYRKPVQAIRNEHSPWCLYFYLTTKQKLHHLLKHQIVSFDTNQLDQQPSLLEHLFAEDNSIYCSYAFSLSRPRLCLHPFTTMRQQDLQCRFHHQWNKKMFAVAYVLVLNSHHPRSRHQEGWHSHSQSSVRT